MSIYFLGLMSGTSLDGVDAALVDFSRVQPKLIATHYEKMPLELRKKILALCTPGPDEIIRLGETDRLLGKYFAQIANTLLTNHSIDANKVSAIGSHGQTIRHYPNLGFTLQIGDPNIIAAETGITTIADFRRRDMAEGGQGAPLVPAFHSQIFASPDKDRVIVNIGGIANITLLPKNTAQTVVGFDTGPGNTLLDMWAEKNLNQSYDKNGDWAASGKLQNNLLTDMLNDAYFKAPAPKSTGREYFNYQWLEKFLHTSLKPADVQATLTELTAKTIIEAIQQYFSNVEIFICGGGAHNSFLMSRLKALAKNNSVTSTEILGVDPDWVEAMAFAWLAKQTFEKKTGNLKAATGARRDVILGGVYY